MTDHLASNASTWKRQPGVPGRLTPEQTSLWWRQIAEDESDMVIAAEYRSLADTLDRFISLRRGAR